MLQQTNLPAPTPKLTCRNRGRNRLWRAFVAGVLAVFPIAGVHAQTAPHDIAIAAANGVTTIEGSVRITSPFFLESRTDPYVLLADLGARLTGASGHTGTQTVAELVGDPATEATYTMALPIQPTGTLLDLAHGEGGGGVQIYSVEVISNVIDDPFFDTWEMTNWLTGISSFQVDYETNAVSGRFVLWAPDDEQLFPSSGGNDGVLFTDDDPVQSLDAGWTVVDVDGDATTLLRDRSVEVQLTQADLAYQDLSAMSYVDAFDTLVEDLRIRYAFKEVKAIDFDAIIAEIRPQIVEAERGEDHQAFHVAMMDFAKRFHDGHVSVAANDDYLFEHYGGGLGLTIAETDSGHIMVVTVTPDGPADAAGIVPGARILTWNDSDTDDALTEVELFRGASSPHGLRAQQLDLLPRLPAGDDVELSFRNPGATRAETVELTAIADEPGLQAIRTRHNPNPAALPISAELLPSGVGYIRITGFFEDVSLMVESWQWAMAKMEELNAPALIIDVRGNGGGWGQMATYFAGSFTDDDFTLAQNYMADGVGEWQRLDEIQVEPSPIQWNRPVAVLIDSNCASACEIFSAAMSHDPDHHIVGTTPTAGVEAGVLPWTLPDDIYFQASVFLMRGLDGTVFLEGEGVPPTIDVPVTATSLLSAEDEVLQTADDALQEQLAGPGRRDRAACQSGCPEELSSSNPL